MNPLGIVTGGPHKVKRELNPTACSTRKASISSTQTSTLEGMFDTLCTRRTRYPLAHEHEMAIATFRISQQRPAPRPAKLGRLGCSVLMSALVALVMTSTAASAQPTP